MSLWGNLRTGMTESGYNPSDIKSDVIRSGYRANPALIVGASA